MVTGRRLSSFADPDWLAVAAFSLLSTYDAHCWAVRRSLSVAAGSDS